MLEFHARLALDATGRAARLAVVRRYARGPGAQGIPFEAAVYDLNGGAPLVAIRNIGNVDDDARFRGLDDIDCELEPVPTQNGLWLVGNPGGQNTMVAGWTGFKDHAPIALRPIDATREAFDVAISGSDEVLGLEHEDGKLVRGGVDSALDASTYGPSVRVRLEQVLGTDFIVSNTQPGGATQFFRFDRSGTFSPLAIHGTLARFDGARVASVERASDEETQTPSGWVVSTAPFSAGTASQLTMNEVTRITDEELIVTDASLGDGVLALAADVGFRANPNRVLMLVSLDGSGVARRDLGPSPALGTKISLVGNDATHVYFTEGDFSDSRLVRYSVTR